MLVKKGKYVKVVAAFLPTFPTLPSALRFVSRYNYEGQTRQVEHYADKTGRHHRRIVHGGGTPAMKANSSFIGNMKCG